MYFDRFDICEAYYLALQHHHDLSDEYDRLSRMSAYFSPRHSLGVETLTENGRDIYECVCRRMEQPEITENDLN